MRITISTDQYLLFLKYLSAASGSSDDPAPTPLGLCTEDDGSGSVLLSAKDYSEYVKFLEAQRAGVSRKPKEEL